MMSVTRDMIRYRLAQAQETIKEASLLLDQGTARGAMNRIYYAMFYARWPCWRRRT